MSCHLAHQLIRIWGSHFLLQGGLQTKSVIDFSVYFDYKNHTKKDLTGPLLRNEIVLYIVLYVVCIIKRSYAKLIKLPYLLFI